MRENSFENMHIELGGNYTMKHKIIIDAAEIFPGNYEVMTLRNGEELECKNADSIQSAKKEFVEMTRNYAEPIQKAFIDANMKPGEKYTLFYLGEFGFPVVLKFTYHDMELTTYAQYSDTVTLIAKPYKKRSLYKKNIHNQSFILCKSWHDINETETNDVLKNENGVKISRSKYGCFDARYIEDAKNYLPDIIAVYDQYKTGVNGKVYA